MYEHVNVPEPTCEGWWWRCLGDERKAVYCYRATHASSRPIWVWREDKVQCGCRHDSPTWTGPIPVPGDKSAPSEDERWGERLYGIFHSHYPEGVDDDGFAGWEDAPQSVRVAFERAARHFLTECVALSALPNQGEAPEVIDEGPAILSLAPGASVTFDVDGVRKFVVKADK